MATIKLILKIILYQPLYNILIFLVWLIPGHNVGWAIIILTVIIRIILLPSSLKAARAQLKLRDLQPELQKIQEKYKDDKTAQSKAMMDFYKTNNVHPLSSCLPLLIQFPILIVLYYVFIHGLSTDSFYLLYRFTPRPEFINTIFLGLDLAKVDRWILPVIAGVLQYFQGRQLQPPTQPGAKPEMQSMISKQMLYLMPIFTVFIAGKLPAALPLYWIITTLFAIGQQWWAARGSEKFEIRNPKSATNEEKGEMIKNKNEIDKTIKHGVEVTVRRKK